MHLYFRDCVTTLVFRTPSMSAVTPDVTATTTQMQCRLMSIYLNYQSNTYTFGPAFVVRGLWPRRKTIFWLLEKTSSSHTIRTHTTYKRAHCSLHPMPSAFVWASRYVDKFLLVQPSDFILFGYVRQLCTSQWHSFRFVRLSPSILCINDVEPQPRRIILLKTVANFLSVSCALSHVYFLFISFFWCKNES